jgi:ribosome maturation factor RimP
MLLKEDIAKIAKDKIVEIGGFLVDVKIGGNNTINVFFDKNKGVVVEDCILITKHIESHFDREIEDYELTVCSAGLTSPFLVKGQYKKNIGKEVVVKLKDGTRKSGVIKSYDENLILEVLKKKKNTRKEYYLEEVSIALLEIKETKLKINFK